MKTVLLAWEHGRGLGHHGPLFALADRLCGLAEDAGTELRCVFALKDPLFARRGAADASRHRFLAAPGLGTPWSIVSHTGSYSDRLADFGFGNAETLSAMLVAWDDVFALTSPDLIVADDSPAAVLAAHGSLPVAAAGNGYTLPPSGLASYPPLRSRAVTTYAEPRLLETTNQVLEGRGSPPLATLPSLFDCPVRGVFTLPQLDPYAPMRGERVLGAYGEGLRPSPPGSPSILYAALPYLTGVEIVGACLADLGMPVKAFLPGPPSSAAQFLRLRGADMLTQERDVSAAVAEASVVVCHGITSVVQDALAIGRPHFVISIDDETRLLAGQIEVLGTGLGFRFRPQAERELEADDDQQAIELALGMLRDGAYAARAASLAEEIAQLGLPTDPIGDFARQCFEHIAA